MSEKRLNNTIAVEKYQENAPFNEKKNAKNTYENIFDRPFPNSFSTRLL